MDSTVDTDNKNVIPVQLTILHPKIKKLNLNKKSYYSLTKAGIISVRLLKHFLKLNEPSLLESGKSLLRSSTDLSICKPSNGIFRGF